MQFRRTAIGAWLLGLYFIFIFLGLASLSALNLDFQLASASAQNGQVVRANTLDSKRKELIEAKEAYREARYEKAFYEKLGTILDTLSKRWDNFESPASFSPLQPTANVKPGEAQYPDCLDNDKVVDVFGRLLKQNKASLAQARSKEPSLFIHYAMCIKENISVDAKERRNIERLPAAMLSRIKKNGHEV